MFQFTTTNVINSKKDLTTGKDLWVATAADPEAGTEANLSIKRVGNFKPANVEAIYKAVAVEPENAKVTIDFSKITATKGDVLRLSIYIGLTQASQDSRYSNDLIYKGKPFAVDFVWKDTAAATVEAIVKTIKKYQLTVYGETFLNVTYSGALLSLEAVNEYQRFRTVNVEKFDETKHFGMGEYTIIRSLDDISEKTKAEVATAEGIFKGVEGFGTYSFLLHNLRLPTSARTGAFSINQDETPIVGAKYNQYTIHYCVNRGPLGMNAVGDTVKSVTTHVFYVLSDLCTEFEKALEVIKPTAGIVQVPA